MKTRRAGIRLLRAGCLLLVALLAGCVQGSTSEPYSALLDAVSLSDGTVAENAAYCLEWDKGSARILLKDKTDGTVWATTPAADKPHPFVASPLYVDYIVPTGRKLGYITRVNAANGAAKKGTITSEAIPNGIRVVYHFDEEKIRIPVEYVLREDSLAVSVNVADIEEHENQIYQIGLLPFLCAVENQHPDSYLFVPSGCGALLVPGTARSGAREYSEEIYGPDAVQKQMEKPTNTEAARLPVFGVKAGSSALLAIAEEGAEALSVNAQAGNERYGYSSVYATLSLRGSETVESKVAGVKQRVTLFSEQKPDNLRVTIGYYPLRGDNAGYTGMALRYREFLVDHDEPTGSQEERLLNLKLLGGVMTRRFFLGVPYDALQPLTTLSQAGDILSELFALTGEVPAVELCGYGTAGLSGGAVAGGGKLGGALGSPDDWQKLSAYARQADIPLFLDFDTVYFTKSGNGVSSVLDTAKAANRQTAYHYSYEPAWRTIDEDADRMLLMQRSKLPGVAERLLGTAQELDADGVGLSVLSQTAYSDYGDSNFFVKAGMAAQVQEVIGQFREGGVRIAVNNANSYAAASADWIFDAPLRSSGYDALDEEVPFYQIVFKGLVPMAGTAVNLASDPQEAILRSVEGGCGLTFALIHEYAPSLLDSQEAKLYGMRWADNRASVAEAAAELAEYFQAVRGAGIAEHERLANGLRRTGFTNGVSVLVNFTEQEQWTESGPVPPRSWRVEGGTA